jgi:ribosomal protein L11 methyltransferase
MFADDMKLCIYYMEGHVEGRDQALGDAYLGCWQEAGDAFLFFERPSDGAVERLLGRFEDLALKDRYQMSYAQWQGSTPRIQRYGRFVLLPPDHPESLSFKEDGLLAIRLHPGLVFGNGAHTTTQDCLAALNLVSREKPFARVLDIGTGSGVLSLAAARIGCQKVLALDLNRLAARTALVNVRLNGLTDAVLVAQACALDYMHVPADLVMANIHFDIMRQMVSDRSFLDHSLLILSGLLRSQSRYIQDQLLRNGFHIRRVWNRDGIWCTLLAESRRHSSTITGRI